MTLLIIDGLLFAAGIWMIVQGRVPAGIFGGSRKSPEGIKARILGGMLLLPLGVGLTSNALAITFFGEDSSSLAICLEVATLVVIGLGALVYYRIISEQLVVGVGADGKIQGQPDDIEGVIAKKARGALIYSILGILGVSGVILWPLAYFYSGQALNLIETTGLGVRHMKNALQARRIIKTALWFYLFLVGGYMILIVLISLI